MRIFIVIQKRGGKCMNFHDKKTYEKQAGSTPKDNPTYISLHFALLIKVDNVTNRHNFPGPA